MGSSPRWAPPRRAQHVGGGAQAPPHRDARVLDPPGRQHAGPCDRDDAAAVLRSAGRVRRRLRDHLPDRRTSAARIKDDETRRAVIRAYNIVSAEYFGKLGGPHDAGRDHSDASRRKRRSPSWNSPPSNLGPRLGCSAAHSRASAGPGEVRSRRRRDSPSGTKSSASTVYYDYDPVWAKCRELKIAPTFHSTGSNQGLRTSPTNFVYNHIGHFADAGHAACKGIFLGGVTRRFPELRFAFLEGGVGWAVAVVRRPDRALGTPQRQGAGTHEAGEARREAADEPGREIRLQRHRSPRCRSATARRTPNRLAPAGSKISTISRRARSPARKTGRSVRQRRSISAARRMTA